MIASSPTTEGQMRALLGSLYDKYRERTVWYSEKTDEDGGYDVFIELDDGRTAEARGFTKAVALAQIDEQLDRQARRNANG